MKNILLKLSLLVIILGVVGFSLNFAFGGKVIPYITRETINGITLYKYNAWGYLENLKTAFTNTPELGLTFQQRQWINELTGWDDFGNNMAFMLNVVITGINILIYPLRLVFFTMELLLAILGLPIANGYYDANPLKWLIDLTKTMATLQIPYV